MFRDRQLRGSPNAECFVQVLAYAPGECLWCAFGHGRAIDRKRTATAGRWLPLLRPVGGRFTAGASKQRGFGHRQGAKLVVLPFPS